MSAIRLLEPSGEIRLRIAAVGDVAVIGRARARARREGYDAPFAAFAPHLRAAPVGFANLEFPVGEPTWVRSGRAAEFWHDREVILALARSGTSVVSLANNHMMDCGSRGLARTLETARSAGVQPVGAGQDLQEARRPAILETEGMRVVVLGYAASPEDRARPGVAGIAPLEPGILIEDLDRWRDEADLLVVSVHWGSMYVDYPPARVLKLARLLAARVDVVLGHHPHVTQGCCRAGRNLTLFSLGDVCFDPHAGDVHATVAAETRRESGVFTVLWAEEPGLDYVPLSLDADGIARVPDPERARAQAARLGRLSAGLADGERCFAEDSAPRLLRYELESLADHLRRGRIDRVMRLLGEVRPRHLPILWQALRRFGRHV